MTTKGLEQTWWQLQGLKSSPQRSRSDTMVSDLSGKHKSVQFMLLLSLCLKVCLYNMYGQKALMQRI